MNFYVFAWIGSAAYALETITSKLTGKYSTGNPWLFNFLWNFFILAFMLPIALYNGAGIPTHWGYIILAAIFYAASGLLFVSALFRLDVSTLTPMFNIRTVIAVLFGVLFLHETVRGYQYALMAIILVFGVFVNIDEKFSVKSFFNKGVLFALLLMITLPLDSLFIKQAIAQTGYWNTTLWSSIIGQIFLLLTIPLFKKDLVNLKPKYYGAAAITGLAGLVGTLATNKAFSMNVGISSAILSVPLSLILVAIFAIFKPTLLEKHTLKVYIIRYTSAAIMILAALKLG